MAISRLALYEPAYMIDEGRPLALADFAARLTKLVASGRRADAVEYWLEQTVRMPAPAIAVAWKFSSTVAVPRPAPGTVMFLVGAAGNARTQDAMVTPPTRKEARHDR